MKILDEEFCHSGVVLISGFPSVRRCAKLRFASRMRATSTGKSAPPTLIAERQKIVAHKTKTAGIIERIIQTVEERVSKTPDMSKDAIEAYADLLKAAAELENALPSTTVTSFDLTRPELKTIIVYGAGGLLLLFTVTSLLPSAVWKADNLVNIFLYWTVVMATLLGADAVKALTNK